MTANERCDNGNDIGCSKNCVEDHGYKCSGQLGGSSQCETICGDGIRVGDEECDNKNKLGCSKDCETDVGYACTG